jgi:hypothetical protein
MFSLALLTASTLTAALAAPQPGGFVRTIDNPWYPHIPGSTYRYRGHDGATPVTDVLHVTHRVKRIEGVPTTVVRDRVLTRGRVIEDTRDFYAQDVHGTVWYFGENTKTLDRHGHVRSREGTWRAGRHGARAGIFMPRHPKVGRSYQQEHYRGHAEDHFRIVNRRAHVRTPFVSSRHALATREWTPLEPGVRDKKVYVRGIGTVLETTLRGGSEHLELVAYRKG